MTDQALFVVAPYLAASFFVVASVVRYVRWHIRADREVTTPSGDDGPRLLLAATRVGVGVVALGHLVAFAVPDFVLLWDRQLARLLVLEAAGIVAGAVALAGLVAAYVRQMRAPHPHWWGAWSPIDVVTETLVLMATITGLSIAVRYRWASAWAEVTVVPYVQSLVQLSPSTTLVAQLPFLVRLHVFGAFVLLAVAPMSGMVRFVSLPVHRLTQRAIAPAANVLCPAVSAIAGWGTTCIKDACAALVGPEREEN